MNTYTCKSVEIEFRPRLPQLLYWFKKSLSWEIFNETIQKTIVHESGLRRKIDKKIISMKSIIVLSLCKQIECSLLHEDSLVVHFFIPNGNQNGFVLNTN